MVFQISSPLVYCDDILVLPLFSMPKNMKLIKFNKGRVIYAIGFLPKRFWFESWLPSWHNGRGKYFTLGLWLISIYKGY